MPKPDSLVDGFVYQNEAEFDGGYGASYGYNTRETDKISEIYLNYTRKLTDDYGFTVKHLDSTDSDRLFAEVRDGDELVAVLCTTAVNGEIVLQVLFLDE